MSARGISCSVLDSVTTTPYFRLELIGVKTVRLEKYIRLEPRTTFVEYYRIEIDDEGEFQETVGMEMEVEMEEIIGMEVLVNERITFEEVVGLEIERGCIDDYDELADLELD
jgi:hypothetical protein